MFYNLSIIIGANHRYKNHQSGFCIIGKVTKRKRSLPAVNQNCVCWTGAGVGVGLCIAYWVGTGGWRIYLPSSCVYIAFYLTWRKMVSMLFVLLENGGSGCQWG